MEPSVSVVSRLPSSSLSFALDCKRGVCKFFQTTGQCRKGEQCDFAHMMQMPPLYDYSSAAAAASYSAVPPYQYGYAAAAAPMSFSSAVSIPASTPAPLSSSASLDGRRPCKFFRETGFCRKGSTCDFAHIADPSGMPQWPMAQAPPPMMYAQPAYHTYPYGAAPMGGPMYGMPHYGPPAGSSGRVCKYHLQGHCTKGELCDFIHLPKDKIRRGPTDKPCQFFAQGHCKKGDTCDFAHVLPNRDTNGGGQSGGMDGFNPSGGEGASGEKRGVEAADLDPRENEPEAKRSRVE
eukprot:gnl/Spiro4/5823_TR2971_c0_g1_i4.p1 gnl/Spiro4/5823_TR2971_c0_g1~~gnl/Spiro4/5823_TR2971_c0_g1_i4.p1  ORF type:complete len:292 (-),score=48.52 gnl/Spiro4/5823_TR2971_c0_g1_i4:352-1227(-)